MRYLMILLLSLSSFLYAEETKKGKVSFVGNPNDCLNLLTEVHVLSKKYPVKFHVIVQVLTKEVHGTYVYPSTDANVRRILIMPQCNKREQIEALRYCWQRMIHDAEGRMETESSVVLHREAVAAEEGNFTVTKAKAKVGDNGEKKPKSP